MSMRFFYNNLIDVPGVGITATSAQTALPATNVAQEHMARTWRTTGSNTSEYVQFDLGSAKSVSSLLVAGHDLTAGDSNIYLAKTNSLPFFSDHGDTPMTYASGVISNIFTAASWRYWQFRFDKSASSQIRNIGRIFLGAYTDISEDFDWGDFDQGRKDLSLNYRSIGGQTWSEQREQYRIFTGTASAVSQASADSLETIASAVGTHTPFFVRLNTSDSTSVPTGEYLYVKFRSLQGRKVSGYDGEYKWDVKIELEEQL